MQILFSNIFPFVLGLIVGSFLNCVIYRLEKNRSFMKGRSYCPKCRHLLGWKDLIPVLSFVFLKAKCRYCGKKISWQYPLVEIITGFIFLLIFYFAGQVLTFQGIINLIFFLIVASFLIIIFVFDLKHFIIPDKVLFPLIIISFLYLIFNFLFGGLDFRTLVYHFLSAVLASGFFLAIILGSKGKWMGMGDAKLIFFLGLFCGFPQILVSLFFAFMIGAIIGIGTIFLGKNTLKSEIPFGPFLIMGLFLSFFWGDLIINWYFNLIYLNF